MSDSEELAHAIAGAGGGALSMIVTYPLVTLSTLAQTTKKVKEEKQQKQVENGEKKEVKVSSTNATVEAFNKIVKEKGYLGLYSGLESALYGITLTNFIYYYFYELTSNVFLRSNALGARKGKGLSTIQSIITGAIAGAVTCVGSNPFWVANTRTMTAQKEGKSTNTFRTIFEIIENDGISSLFAGVLPALVLVINPIIQYTIFEQIKNFVVANKGKKSFTPIMAFFIGALGKLIATSLTYPYITLKSRMHIRKKKQEGEKQISMIDEIRKIINDEGLDGLYNGLSVKLIQSISTAAFLFYFKETLLVGSLRVVEILRLLKLKKTTA